MEFVDRLKDKLQERRLESLREENKRRQEELESLDRELELAERKRKAWKPLKKELTRESSLPFGDMGEERHVSWPKAFVWEWTNASSEEEQMEVFKKYVNRLTYSQQMGFTKETAAKRLLSILARQEKEGEV